MAEAPTGIICPVQQETESDIGFHFDVLLAAVPDMTTMQRERHGTPHNVAIKLTWSIFVNLQGYSRAEQRGFALRQRRAKRGDVD